MRKGSERRGRRVTPSGRAQEGVNWVYWSEGEITALFVDCLVFNDGNSRFWGRALCRFRRLLQYFLFLRRRLGEGFRHPHPSVVTEGGKMPRLHRI